MSAIAPAPGSSGSRITTPKKLKPEATTTGIAAATATAVATASTKLLPKFATAVCGGHSEKFNDRLRNPVVR